MTAAIAVLVLCLFVSGVQAVRAGERRQAHRNLVTLRLRFPRDLDPASATQLLSGFSGLLVPRWQRWLSPAVVILEVRATAEGIEHLLTVPDRWLAAVENLLQAHLPGASYDKAEPTMSRPDVAAEYTATSGSRPLRIDAEALSASLLSSLQPLGRSEQITVQWLITPHGPVPLRETRSRPWLKAPQRPSAEAAAALRRKQAHPQFLAVARIGTWASSLRTSRQLLRRAEVAWHGTRAPGIHLKRRLLPERVAADRSRRQVVPASVWPLVLGADELTGLIGWPLGGRHAPGLSLGGHRQLPATRSVPRKGSILGVSTFPGDTRPVAVDVSGRLRHLHVMGPTGVGKSTLLANLVAQDMRAGYGVVVIDPKGDLVNEVLGLVPDHRQHEVIVLDPADDGRPVGLNPLRSATASREVVVENLVGLFKSLYRSSWGPRTDDILRAALQTLASSEEATMCEVSLLLTDASFRRRLVGSLDDPIGLEAFWGWYEAISDAERLSVVGPVLNKVRAFTMRPRVRAIVGQARPELDFTRVLRDGGIVLVSLASGLLGNEAADLLGALVMAELWNATTARSGIEPSRRRPVMAYVDEAQRVMHLPTSTADALAEARGFGLGLTLAHQHLGQLPPEMREALLANARSRVVFQLGSSDARTLAKDLGGLTSDDLEGLGPYEFAAQVFAGGHRQPPFTARALPPAVPVSDGLELRVRSRERFGVDRAEVEQLIRDRQAGGRKTDQPIGSKRRSGGPSGGQA